uniref:Uncharacterized protein n=1 Tax=Tanacetum cinerariifolium TaxID=118510 RepID=A0A699JB39_TANCI|nr:hypothetical protein [Tanacetum cinerariifolium]
MCQENKKNKDKPTKKGITGLVIDEMRILVDQKKFKSRKVYLHPDMDMAFVASIIKRDAVDGGNSIY